MVSWRSSWAEMIQNLCHDCTNVIVASTSVIPVKHSIPLVLCLYLYCISSMYHSNCKPAELSLIAFILMPEEYCWFLIAFASCYSWLWQFSLYFLTFKIHFKKFCYYCFLFLKGVCLILMSFSKAIIQPITSPVFPYEFQTILAFFSKWNSRSSAVFCSSHA